MAGRLRASRAELFKALQPEELSQAHLFVLGETMAHIEELEARMGRFELEFLKGLSAWQTELVLLQTISALISTSSMAAYHDVDAGAWSAAAPARSAKRSGP